MMSGNKIIMRNDPSQPNPTVQNLMPSTAPISTVDTFVNSNLISSTKQEIPQTTTYYLNETSKNYIMINRDSYETTELTEGVLDQKEVIIEEM